jgi:hypothetical protein
MKLPLSIAYLILLLAIPCHGQQAELKNLCKELDALFTQSKPLHVQYQVTVKGRSTGEEEQVKMNLYKRGDQQDLIMGQAQEVVMQGSQVLQVNHMQKAIVLQEDTTGISNYTFMKDLNLFIDSASTCKKTQSNGIVTYTLSYPKDYIYQQVKFSFTEKTRRLKTLYAEFSPAYPEPYHSFRVEYELWDLAWKPQAGFPNMERFIARTGNSYKVQTAWKEYQFYQPQKGTLKY